MKKFLILFFACAISLLATAQRGKSNAPSIIAANTIVNEYTHLTVDAAAGSTSITVSASGLNVNNRFGAGVGFNLAAGDLIFIYQAQGAKLTGAINTVYGIPNDSSWGGVLPLNYKNCGLYEFQEVSAVPNATTITLECGLTNSYSDTGMVQVIRVPRYSSLTIPATLGLTAQAWNGVTGEGGILVVEVLGNTVINGKMDVSGLGFRGGVELDNNSTYGGGYYSSINSGEGEDKGEGIGGYETKYDPLGGHRSMGAPANGGGGGRCHNGGGGGGANGGIVLNWNGSGNADHSVPSYVTAWNLEAAGFANHTSSGGGRGGYSFASSAHDPTLNGPINGIWGGDDRKISGGLGGRPLDYSTGRLFLGGGGGAGDQDNSKGGVGGKGGGLIYVMNYGTITGTNGQINANGNNGGNTVVNSFASNSSDGAGGAGGGGAIVINSVGAVSGFTASANGGTGGIQVLNTATGIGESEGPGGGGGGGYIAISNGAIVQTALGGANGTTQAPGMNPKFPANGATEGGTGTTNQPITSFTISTKTDTICAGSTASLTATLVGTVPAGTTIMWYTTPSGGVSVGSGNPFVTPVINSTAVYYAGTCPGTYRMADTVKILPAPIANAGANVTTCGGGSTILTASGGGTYSWSPSTGLTSTTNASTTASPASTQTYTVTVGNAAGCTNTATVTVTVGPGLSPTASSTPTTICQGKSSALTSGGGISYSWSPGTGLSATNISNPTATPATTTSYTVTVKDAGGCTGTATTTVTVNARPAANAGPNTAECIGFSALLNASGGGTYSWSPAAGLSNAAVSNPTATDASSTTYTVTIVDLNGCRDSSTTVLTVNQKPVIGTNPSPGICSGGSVTLTATGASSYSWTPSTGLSSTTVSNPSASPASSTTYTVTGTDVNGCINQDTVTVRVGSSMTLITSANTAICQGGPGATITASGATSYTWSPATGLSSSTVSNPVANPSGTQTYTVVGTTGGCSGTDSVTVTVNSLPVANAGSNTAYCAGGSTLLAGSGGPGYMWSPSSGLSSTTIANPTANPLLTTIYTLTVTDVNNCSKSSQVTVTVNQLPVISVSGNLSVCKGSATTLTANGASSYSWSPGTGLSTTNAPVTAASPILNTTYTITGTDVNNCINTSTVAVIVDSLPRVSVTASQTSFCTTGCVTLSGLDSAGSCSSVVYDFGDGTTGTNPTHCYTAAGNYAIIFSCKDAKGCIGAVTIPNYIHALAPPVASFTVNPGIIINYTGATPDSVCFTNASSGASGYSWTFGNGTGSTIAQPCTFYPDSGSYCINLTATAPNSCKAVSTTCIELVKFAEVSYTIPNVFSPNGDLVNDVFFIKNTGLQTLDCKIYDRWGVKLFEFNSLTGSWDGNRSGGMKATDGVYYYIVNLTTLAGDKKEEKGFLTLLRD
jgi:gliding motility-associated-like protein